MSFKLFVLKKIGAILGSIFILICIFLYGIVMFHVLAGSNGLTVEENPFFTWTMIGLTVSWILSAVLGFWYIQYSEETKKTEQRFMNIVGSVWVGSTIMGGVVAFIYMQYFF